MDRRNNFNTFDALMKENADDNQSGKNKTNIIS